jgi:hypothetical protein
MANYTTTYAAGIGLKAAGGVFDPADETKPPGDPPADDGHANAADKPIEQRESGTGLVPPTEDPAAETPLTEVTPSAEPAVEGAVA